MRNLIASTGSAGRWGNVGSRKPRPTSRAPPSHPPRASLELLGKWTPAARTRRVSPRHCVSAESSFIEHHSVVAAHFNSQIGRLDRLTQSPAIPNLGSIAQPPWWMRRARPACRVPDTERRALSTLQRAGFVGWISAAHPPSASLPARCRRAATQKWNCCAKSRIKAESPTAFRSCTAWGGRYPVRCQPPFRPCYPQSWIHQRTPAESLPWRSD